MLNGGYRMHHSLPVEVIKSQKQFPQTISDNNRRDIITKNIVNDFQLRVSNQIIKDNWYLKNRKTKHSTVIDKK